MAVIVSCNCEPPLSVTTGRVAFWKLAVLTIILVALIREKMEFAIVFRYWRRCLDGIHLSASICE
jgi:hypothetical protein